MRYLLLLFAPLVIGCGGAEKTRELETVRLATRKHLSSAPIYIADEEGFFADEGIRLEYTEAPGRSMQAIPLMENGDVDVLASAVSAGLFTAAAGGSVVRIVADRGHVSTTGCDFNAILGRAGVFATDSPSREELLGKVFSINTAGTADFIIDKFLASRQLDAQDVRTISLTDVMEPQALANGGLDVIHAAEPYLSYLRKAGHRLIARAGQYAPRAHFGVIIFGRRLTVENRELGARFLTAYLRGVRQHAQGATPGNVEIIAKRMGYDREWLRDACLASVSESGTVDTEWLMEFQRWSLKKGYGSQLIPVDKIVDPWFAGAASARLDSIEASR
jgi:NitT/TauT family transport system substrate-binding protein